MKRAVRVIAVGLAMTGCLAAGCGQGGVKPGDPGMGDMRRGETEGGMRERIGVTNIVVTEAADDGASDGPQIPRPEVSWLEESAVQAIYRRLPAMSGQEDEGEFRMRESSRPRPRTGETVKTPFPPEDGPSVGGVAPADADADAGAPLEIVRHQPDGEVPRPPRVSVTFSQPMVAVTSHAETIRDGVPVTLTPQPEGQWRWVGTRTLMFEPDDVFPMATDYTIEVAAGQTATSGARLAEPFRATFSTEPVKVVRLHPAGHGPQTREPLIFIGFNQRINPDAILEYVELSAGAQRVGARPASREEIAGDEAVSRLVEGTEAGTWLAVKPTETLPAASTIAVKLRAGAPSAEGPRTSTEEQRFTFETHGDLEYEEHRCGWGQECRPGDTWTVSFSNPLATDQDAQSLVRVSPEVAGLDVLVAGPYVQINGLKPARTKYTVEIAAGLTDVFGQQLGEPVEVTFDVGGFEPYVASAPGRMVVLEPEANGHFTFTSVNVEQVHVRAYRVTPADWVTFVESEQRYDAAGVEPPGEKVFDGKVALAGEDDVITETQLDLRPWLGSGGLGHVVLEVERVDLPDDTWNRKQHIWVQSTRLGLDAFVEPARMIAWATDLADGKPAGGVQITLAGGPASGGGAGANAAVATTGEDGLATIAASVLEQQKPRLLVATRGDDVAMLPDTIWSYGSRFNPGESRDEYRWYVLDDRTMYRPGEEVHVKGWVRVLEGGTDGDLRGVAAGRRVTYQVFDPRGNRLTDGETALGALGGFNFSFGLPDDANLGYARVEVTVPGTDSAPSANYSHGFQIQEFRRPEFEVVANSDAGPHLLGDRAQAWVEANYYAGGGLAQADVNWRVVRTRGHYAPPGHADYAFGEWRPWWWWGGDDDDAFEEVASTLSGKTDFQGEHRIDVRFESLARPLPYVVDATASVQDVNRQAWESTTQMLVHPGQVYVGLKSDRYFVGRNEPLHIDVIAAEIDGAIEAGRPIEVVAERLRWTVKDGQWKEEVAANQTCNLTSTAEPGRCTFDTPEGGEYRITAIVEDAKGRINQTRITRWVAGGEQPPQRTVEQEEVTLIPDKDAYAPGDVAEVLVQVPFYPAEALVTLRRQGIVREERVAITGPTHTLRVPLEERHIPNVFLAVDLAGSAPRLGADGLPDASLPRRPAYASGSIKLPISARSRELTVEVTPASAGLDPGAQAAVDVVVRDAHGLPVPDSEVLLFAVDEAVLALSNYTLADPLEVFYTDRLEAVSAYRSRQYVVLSNLDLLASGQGEEVESKASFGESGMGAPPPMARAMAAPMMADEMMVGARGGGGLAGGPIAVRQNFDPLAAFEPTLRTDGNGRVRASFTLPDNLTRYRLMAVAVEGERRFGSGESNLTARLPLMVRPSPPRFLNFGDRFEMPIVLQNQTGQAMQVEVAIRGRNLHFTRGHGLAVEVPANDRVEVRFPAEARLAGKTRIQVGAVSAAHADAAEFEFPVWTPATTEAFATYGTIDKGAVFQPVAAPDEVFPQFGGLEVTTSSTELQALTDAMLHLVNYPFECSEQIASRVLAVAALRDVLQAFQVEGMPTPAEIEEAMARDITRLEQMQNHDGGFGFWRRGQESWPYVSLHVAHALRRAQAKGYEVPAHVMQRSQQYLHNIERHVPQVYGEHARYALKAYALFVRQIGGDRDVPGALSLYERAGLDKLSLEAVGWLLHVMAGEASASRQISEIRRHLGNRVQETAATAQFGSDYGDANYLMLYTSRRTDGVLLEALLADQPKSDLVPKLVRGLLGHRSAGPHARGHWGTTQDNAFVLLALDRYFHIYEGQTPAFVARAWLGEDFAGEHAFRGRTTERHQIEIPMEHLARTEGEQMLTLQKDGTGRMYYRIGMRYAPRSLQLEPADHGFAVERLYEPVDDESDVQRAEDGTWQVRAGARVKVTVTMAAPARRYHVALIDPLPAGFEALNPALATTATPPQTGNPNGRPWWWGPWYEHHNMRDERVEAFASLMWGGVHTYTYFARATTPGEFVVPPSRAEEMYHPETFGRSATDRVVVR